MRPLTTPVALRQARQHLLESGQCPSGLVDERLARSWSRSMAAGLMPTGRPQSIDHPSSGTLRHVLASNPELLAHSRPVMEYLFEQVRHSQSVVVLADRRGMLEQVLHDGARVRQQLGVVVQHLAQGGAAVVVCGPGLAARHQPGGQAARPGARQALLHHAAGAMAKLQQVLAGLSQGHKGVGGSHALSPVRVS